MLIKVLTLFSANPIANWKSPEHIHLYKGPRRSHADEGSWKSAISNRSSVNR
jgi:hypothetical protein